MDHSIAIRDKGRDSSHFKISWSRVCVSTISLPVFGFFFAIIWSLLFNFKSSTNTHCRVPNYLPSISAAIDYAPPEYVWRICVTTHSVPRFLIIAVYMSWNRRQRMVQGNKLAQYQGFLAKFIGFANFMELLGLVLLTNISSQDNKRIHVISFTTFIVFSMIYMFTTCLLHTTMENESSLNRKSLRYKRKFCMINIISFFVAMYFYYRHNTYCEHGVYTLFAFFEYIVVLSNMGFHYTACYDFDDCYLKLDPSDDGKAS